METTTTKKNIVGKKPAVEVILTNFDAEKIAERIAKMMPAIVKAMIKREYSKKL